LQLRVSSSRGGGLLHVEVDGRDSTGRLTVPGTGDSSAFETIIRPDVALGAGRHVVRVVFDQSARDGGVVCHLNWIAFRRNADSAGSGHNDPASHEPTGPQPVPGRIEAEAFDPGGEGVGFHDRQHTDYSYPTHYRAGGVGIDGCQDDGGGYNVGGIQAGEWLMYTLDVKETADYDLDLRLSAWHTEGSIGLEFDGAAAQDPISIPNTSTLQRWQTVSARPVRLAKGLHKLRVVFNSPFRDEYVCNFNWFELRKHVTAASQNR
jgi:hypothetical protein